MKDPLLDKRKVTKFPFHVFDRYEIHIQAVVDSIYARCFIFQSSSSETYIQNRYSRLYKINTQIKKTTNKRNLGFRQISKPLKCVDPQV